MSKTIGDFKWEEKDLLGQGAFGKVFKGLQVSKQEVIAVKVLNLDHLSSFNDRMMIKKEIEVLRKLKGNYIARMIDVKAEGK